MSDDNPPEYVKLSPEQLTDLAAFSVGGPDRMFREPVAITDEVVQRWTSIPEGKVVTAPLTRGELDGLFFGMTQTNASVLMLANSIRYLSFEDFQAANVAFQKGTELAQSADANFRLFFRAIMQKAETSG